MMTRISRNGIRALVQCSMNCRGTCRKRAAWSIWKVWKDGGLQVGARTRSADCTAQGGKDGKQGVIVGHTAHLPIRRWRGALGGGGGLSRRGEEGTIAGRCRVHRSCPIRPCSLARCQRRSTTAVSHDQQHPQHGDGASPALCKALQGTAARALDASGEGEGGRA